MAALVESPDNIFPPPILKGRPRSNRKGDLADLSPNCLPSTSMYGSSSSRREQPSAPKRSPPLPPRSPLRPRPRAIVSSTQVLLDARNLAARMDDNALAHSYATISGLLDSMALSESSQSPDEDLSSYRPDSPTVSPIDDEAVSSSSSSSLVPTPPMMSKRIHALMELLTSERAYASDLALIRDIHIPLALGVWQNARLFVILTFIRPTYTIQLTLDDTAIIRFIDTDPFHRI